MAEKKTLTKEQWKEIERKVTLYTNAKLLIDGYQVTVTMYRSKMKLVYMLYINGEFDPQWVFNDCEERKRFVRSVEKYLYSKKMRDDYTKICGKRAAKKEAAEGEGMFQKFTSYDPYWKSFNSMRLHLEKNNESIEIIED